MKTTRLLLAIGLGALGLQAHAQTANFPTRSIRLVIGFAPGGAADQVARAMSDEFA